MLSWNLWHIPTWNNVLVSPDSTIDALFTLSPFWFLVSINASSRGDGGFMTFSDRKMRLLTLTCLSECFLQLWLPLPVFTNLIWLLWKFFLYCNRYSKPQIVQMGNMNLLIPSVHLAHDSYRKTEQLWEVTGHFQMVYFLLSKMIFTIYLSHCKSDMLPYTVWWISVQVKMKRGTITCLF